MGKLRHSKYRLGSKRERRAVALEPWDALSHQVTGVGDSNDTTLGQDNPTDRNARQQKMSWCGC